MDPNRRPLVKSVDSQGIAFIVAHEGFVSHAYLDPVGVLTIGYGFTNRNAVFLKYWREQKGRPMRMGDKISRREADAVIAMILREDIRPVILKNFPNGLPQHQFNAVSSFCYNIGPQRAMKWKWGGGTAARGCDCVGAVADEDRNHGWRKVAARPNPTPEGRSELAHVRRLSRRA